MFDTYKIVRYYRDDLKKHKTILTGLKLEEAKEYCQKDYTKGDGWFDGFVKE